MGKDTKTNNTGQSLIETIMAIFVLTTGLASGLALAIFSFGTSTDISQRIVATGLVREGIEVIRSKRDSNWLSGTLSDCSAWMGTNQQCYQNWLSGFNGSMSGVNYKLLFNPSSITNKWSIVSACGSDYRLFRDNSAGTFTCNPTGGSASPFFRKVTVIHQTTANANQETRVLVRATVWWHGKRCNNSLFDLTSPSQTGCKIIFEEYLTNWRNY